MNTKPVDNYFFKKEGLVRECMIFLRSYILSFDDRLTEEWKYSIPFYCFKGKMLCYLWTDKKTGQPYIGIVDGNKMDFTELVQEKRSRMKILRIDPEAEIPLPLINAILKNAIALRN
jgi:Domain of unknown function (DU1801)